MTHIKSDINGFVEIWGLKGGIRSVSNWSWSSTGHVAFAT